MPNTDHWNRIISNLYRDSDYLMHHGIKGQKWGVRNYQNADGSLTAAGKKRYGTRDVRIRTPERMQKDIIGKAVSFNPEGGGGGGYYEVDEWEDENDKIESEIAQLEKDLEDIEKDLDAVENDSIGRGTPGFNNRENARKDLQKRIKEMKDALKRKRESEQAFLKDYVAKDDVSRKMKTSFGHSDTFNDVLMAYYDNSYLSHHGILGQKWGVRRFQNKDGTLTSAGQKRYAKSLNYGQLNKRTNLSIKAELEKNKGAIESARDKVTQNASNLGRAFDDVLKDEETLVKHATKVADDVWKQMEGNVDLEDDDFRLNRNYFIDEARRNHNGTIHEQTAHYMIMDSIINSDDGKNYRDAIRKLNDSIYEYNKLTNSIGRSILGKHSGIKVKDRIGNKTAAGDKLGELIRHTMDDGSVDFTDLIHEFHGVWDDYSERYGKYPWH